MVQLCLPTQFLRCRWRCLLAIQAIRGQPAVTERRHWVRHAVSRLHVIVVVRVWLSRFVGRSEEDRVERVHGDIRVEVIERREEETRRGEVRARVRRVLSLRL